MDNVLADLLKSLYIPLSSETCLLLSLFWLAKYATAAADFVRFFSIASNSSFNDSKISPAPTNWTWQLNVPFLAKA